LPLSTALPPQNSHTHTKKYGPLAGQSEARNDF
jgi:hypothetical protein